MKSMGFPIDFFFACGIIFLDKEQGFFERGVCNEKN